MSPIGKWLLENCDNRINIDLKAYFHEILKMGFSPLQVELRAMTMRITTKKVSCEAIG